MSTQPTNNAIYVANPPLDGNNITFMTSDVAVSATSITVLSTAGEQFLTSGTVDYYILLGDYGEDGSELTLVDASDAGTDSNSFTTAAIQYSHSASTTVTYIPYNQIKIYGALVSGGSKTLVDTIDIDPSEQYTRYDYAGSNFDYYYTAYYNSTTDVLSAYSDEITTTSFSHNSVKRIVNSGLIKALTKIDENKNGTLTWDIAINVLQDGLDEIITRKRKWDFYHGTDTTITTVAGTPYVELPDDALQVEYVIVNGVKLNWMSRYEYDRYVYAGVSVNNGEPSSYTIKNDKIYMYPYPSVEYNVIVEYYKKPTTITSLSDTIPYPFVVMLTYYCASIFSLLRGNDKRADKMLAKFYKILEEQVNEYTGPIQVGYPEYVEQTQFEDDMMELQNIF